MLSHFITAPLLFGMCYFTASFYCYTMKLEEELNAAEETISFQIDPAAVVIQHLDRAIAQITHDILGKCVVVLLAPINRSSSFFTLS